MIDNILISLSFVFLGRNMNSNEINDLTFKSDRLLGRQSRLTEFLRFAYGDFVPNADHAGHAAYGRLRAGLLVGPFDHPAQCNQAVVHFRRHPVTRNREIPMKRVFDLGADIRHGAPPLIESQTAAAILHRRAPLSGRLRCTKSDATTLASATALRFRSFVQNCPFTGPVAPTLELRDVDAYQGCWVAESRRAGIQSLAVPGRSETAGRAKVVAPKNSSRR